MANDGRSGRARSPLLLRDIERSGELAARTGERGAARDDRARQDVVDEVRRHPARRTAAPASVRVIISHAG